MFQKTGGTGISGNPWMGMPQLTQWKMSIKLHQDIWIISSGNVSN